MRVKEKWQVTLQARYLFVQRALTPAISLEQQPTKVNWSSTKGSSNVAGLITWRSEDPGGPIAMRGFKEDPFPTR